MNTPAPSTPPDDDCPEELLQLVSRQLDGDLDEVDLNRLVTLEFTWQKEAHAFRSRCLLIRNSLFDTSVPRISGLLFSMQSPGKPERTQTVLQSRGVRRLIAGIVTAVLCSGVFLALNRSWQTPQEKMIASSKTIADFPQMNLYGSPPSAAALSVPIASDSASNRLSNTAAAEISADEATSLQPLVDAGNWKVVIVQVSSNNKDAAMDQITAIVREHGLKLRKSAGEDQSDWFGVVLTSAVADQQQLVTAMEKGLGTARPADALDADSEAEKAEILQLVLESLRFPTRSELHHGKVFVALPAYPALGGVIARSENTNRLADDLSETSPAESQSPPALKEDSEASISDQSLLAEKQAPESDGRATLVVFRFETPSAESSLTDPI